MSQELVTTPPTTATRHEWLEKLIGTDERINEADVAMLTTQIRGVISENGFDNDGDWRQVAGKMPATYSGGNSPYVRNWSALFDREDGRFMPFYQTEYDLRAIRAKARNLATFSSIAIGINTALRVYTIGGQWKFEAQAREGQVAPPDLLAAVQYTIDDFLEINEFQGVYDEAIHDAARDDGESLIAMYAQPGGRTKIRDMDPDSLREPQNARQIERGLAGQGYVVKGEQSWTFGVHTAYNATMNCVDHSEPVGYHVVHDESGKSWDYLPAFPQTNCGSRLAGKCLIHMKMNVPPAAKRGISDYYAIQEVLERKHILGRNLAVGAAIQAAIAYIRHHKGNVSRSQVVTQLSSALDKVSANATANRTDGKSQQNFGPGTVIDTPTDYHAGPLGENRSPIFIEVAAYLMRTAGIRFLMPEYMVSGDASNANFASTLVAESPFVRAREADQRKFISNNKKILWAALKIAYDAGRFSRWCPTWQIFRQLVEVAIKAPPVASRDRGVLLEETMTLFEKGLISANDVLSDLNRENKPGWDDKYATPPPPPAPGIALSQLTGTPQIGTPARSAMAAALESVQTTDEARAILESMSNPTNANNQRQAA